MRMNVGLIYGAVASVMLGFAAPAFAGQDSLWASNVNSVTVGGSDATYTTSVAGASDNRTVTITNAIVGSQSVSVDVTWGIGAGSSPRTTTFPKNNVGFTASTTNGADVGAITVAPTTCSFASAFASCSTTISFSSPNVNDSGIQVEVVPSNTGSGNAKLSPKKLNINFAVTQQVEKIDTALTMPDPQCFAYKAGDVDLTATLTELVSGDAISGRQVDFTIDSNPAGSAYTDGAGLATLTYNVNGLAAGDYNLFGAFSGDAVYKPSDDSATLGIYYNFVGFQPPINPEGNSVFGNGRVIPVKIKIVDANLNPVTDAQPRVYMTQASPSTALGTDLEPATSVSAADTDNIMRYVPEDQQYIYNWDLSQLPNGTWYVVVELGDSSACSTGRHYATITVAKRKSK